MIWLIFSTFATGSGGETGKGHRSLPYWPQRPPFSFKRRAPRANDVVIEILYCGVWHSDLYDWGWTNYPIVVGHEIVGRVVKVGPDVTRHKIGDHVAVGTMVDSCQHCDQCRKGEEQLCREGNTQTFAGSDRITGEPTWGGYSKHIVVREEFVLQVPDGLDLAKAGPLLWRVPRPIRRCGPGISAQVAASA
ncbi:alcohol dehydrogenase catalytic domain-containing protein [Mesorhizobium sp. M0152]|uniref:alcohol dehydrogenase catalytic domain-containing protein n=1 Tax=Mesorhizobium sp. M0152 TaxID=2956898 RepID=UPI00333D4D69